MGSLTAQLGADGWELVGVAPGRPAHHTLYYFKRPFDSTAQAEWEERNEHMRQRMLGYLAERMQQAVQPMRGDPQ